MADRFPTEQDNEIGQRIRDQGNEYGTVTKRPRRCGWLDTVAVRYTSRLSGVNSICVMLLDVLSGLEELKICTAYELDGEQTTRFPSHVDDVRRVNPVYETLPGWQEDITGARRLDDLPANARAYFDRISQLVGVPVRDGFGGPGPATRRSPSLADNSCLPMASQQFYLKCLANGGRAILRSSWTGMAGGRSDRSCHGSKVTGAALIRFELPQKSAHD